MHPAPGDRCPRGRQLARQPRGTPTGRCAADAAATHRSRRPADAPGLDLRHGWADPVRQPPTSGVASRRPAPAEVFSMVRNPLPTSSSAGIDLLALRELMGHANPETTAAYVHLSPE